MPSSVKRPRHGDRLTGRMAAHVITAIVVGGLLLAGCARTVDERANAGNVDGHVPLPSLDPEIDTWPAALVTIRPAHEGAATSADAVALAVRVADTPQRRARGFMHVAHVPNDVGMLFVYDDEHSGAFWMADTVVALDIAFVDRAGTIIAIETMAPCTRQPCPHYGPDATYRAALEVSAGWFDAHEVAVGDAVTWSPIDAASA